MKRGAKLEAWGDWVPAWMAALYVNVGIKKALLRGQNQIWIDAFESGCTLLGTTLEPQVIRVLMSCEVLFWSLYWDNHGNYF